MPQKTWVIGEEVLAADFNTYVQNQVIPAFATPAARDAEWVAPPNGAMCTTVDTYTVWLRRAGVWAVYQPDQRRVGCGLTITAFSVPTGGASTNLPWTTELFDTDNFHAPNATPVTVPAGLGGVYTVAVSVDAGGTLNGASRVEINWAGAMQIVGHIPSGQRFGSVSGTIDVAAGVAFNTAIGNGHSGAVNFSARLTCVRVSV